MIKVFVDSGSSIKQNEKEKYDVEILPLKILLEDKEYLDGIDLGMEKFYDLLINKKLFPKTSLPSLDVVEEKVNECVNNGDDVIILSISSGISGTYNAFNLLFSNNDKVKVIDSQTACGGIRILVNEINKYKHEGIDKVLEVVNDLIPRIRLYAVPETLTYLHKGGRLGSAGYIAGSILNIKPIIELRNKVSVAGKVLGLNKAMKELIMILEASDTNYPIVPSYTYCSKNLDIVISKTTEYHQKAMVEKDNLDPAIACHWGPNAFGFFFVEKN